MRVSLVRVCRPVVLATFSERLRPTLDKLLSYSIFQCRGRLQYIASVCGCVGVFVFYFDIALAVLALARSFALLAFFYFPPLFRCLCLRLRLVYFCATIGP